MTDRPAKILGERNSGTNFLARMIGGNWPVSLATNAPGLTSTERATIRRIQPRGDKRLELREALLDQHHFDSLATCGGWKHAAATQEFLTGFARERNAIVLCIVRHPVTWARSMHRNPFHAMVTPPESFHEFLRTPWMTRSRDCLKERLVGSPLTLYAKKVASYHWLARKWPDTVIVRYEDIVLAPERVAETLDEYLGSRIGDLVVPQKNARPFIKDAADFDHYSSIAMRDPFAELDETERDLFQQFLSGTDIAKLYQFG